jgi:predicted dehydrogenase
VTLRVGLIGTGYWARVVHGVSAAGHPEVELVGVWGRDPARAEAVAGELGTTPYADVDALLADTDALTFAVPPAVQVDVAVRAAQRGRHLLLEKPIATSLEDAARLERAVTDGRVASIVFFTRRFEPETVAWLDNVVELGGWECGRVEIDAAAFVEGSPFADSPWRRDKGALWDVGPHALALLWPVLGDVASVVAGAGHGDQVHLVLRHAGGGSSTVSLSLTAPAAAIGSTAYVYGQHGRRPAPTGPLGRPRVVEAHRRALDALIDQARRTEHGHPCDVHFGARVVAVLAAAERSLRTGCRVEVAAGA